MNFKRSNLEEKEYKIGDFTFKCLYTPGHSKDSVTFFFEDENVIVPTPQRAISDDEALEEMILSADEDYKEIEKERYQSNNKLKAFDDKKLPGKKKLEDEIVDYVQVTDIGLNSQSELYSQPIANIAKSVKTIVDVEGPIHIKEVTNRVKDSCHVKRAGSKLKKTVNSAIAEAEKLLDKKYGVLCFERVNLFHSEPP